MGNLSEDEYTYYEDDEQDGETDEYLDCHMDRQGFCGKAGSEECEFDCPYRAEQIEAERKRAARQGRSGKGERE